MGDVISMEAVEILQLLVQVVILIILSFIALRIKDTGTNDPD